MEIVESARQQEERRSGGKQEGVPHLHIQLAGCLFAPLFLVTAAVIAADRRRAASVPEIRLRPHIRNTCADLLIEAVWLLLIGQRVVSGFRLKVTGGRIKTLAVF